MRHSQDMERTHWQLLAISLYLNETENETEWYCFCCCDYLNVGIYSLK
jgi:hypothetical protein